MMSNIEKLATAIAASVPVDAPHKQKPLPVPAADGVVAGKVLNRLADNADKAPKGLGFGAGPMLFRGLAVRKKSINAAPTP